MPDLIAISHGLGALKAATDIIKTMTGLRDSAKILENTVELNLQILSVQKALMDAHAEQAALIEQVRILEKRIAEFETSDAEKTDYELKTLAPGALAYVLKPDASRGEPPHWLCAACYNHSKKEILQNIGRSKDKRKSIYQCPACKNTILVHWSQSPRTEAEPTNQ